MTVEECLEKGTYSLVKKEKQEFLLLELNRLTRVHSQKSENYRKILKAYGLLDKKFEQLEDFPMLPVRLFKDYTLMSCDDADVIKTLTSSGTTSQKVSKIYLDRETSTLQTRTLVKIMQDFLGKKRLPMLIIDSKSVLKDRKIFSARGAGILGLSTFGRQHTYALNEQMEIDFNVISEFFKKHKGEKVFIFGFTFMIWNYFYKKLKEKDIRLNLSNSILVHSGGWKKMINEAVNNKTFKDSLKEQTGINTVHDFYGMVEQVGSIFVECENGHLHTPVFSDVIVRDKLTLAPLSFAKEGIIEVLSVLPRSYPGHVLLTEDIGTVIGEDDCSCGRKGKYFRVHGRLAKAEVRGCSDTHASEKREH